MWVAMSDYLEINDDEQAVRAFRLALKENADKTRRVVALHEEYLARSRPL
jgi:hypothetical protein